VKKFVLIVSVMMIMTACHTSIPVSEDITATATTMEATTTADFVSDEAEGVYNVIMANKSVWDDDGNKMFRTLLDVDFDGSPEFLGGGPGWGYVFNIYKIEGDKLTLFTVLDTFWDSMFMHESEDGLRRWVTHYRVFENKNYYDTYEETKGPYEDMITLYDFTGGEIKEYVKFKEAYADCGDTAYYADGTPIAREEYDESVSQFYQTLTEYKMGEWGYLNNKQQSEAEVAETVMRIVNDYYK